MLPGDFANLCTRNCAVYLNYFAGMAELGELNYIQCGTFVRIDK